MALNIKKIYDNLFEASATPPHVRESWATPQPLSAKQLVTELQARGCHQTDIGDAMYEQDSNWIEKC